MAKSEIVKANPSAPSWLAEQEVQGTELLREYIVPPRLKIVQKSATAELLAKFQQGDIIIVPSMQLVSEMPIDDGRPTGQNGFNFTPLFFFPEFLTWNPYDTKGVLSSVHDRSTDRQSALAKKCTTKALWEEECPESPGGKKRRNCEHLNFVCMIDGIDDPCILSLARATHFAGRQLCNLIRMRKASPFNCVFQAKLTAEKNNLGAWWGIQFSNPEEDISPWIEQEQQELFKEVFDQFAENFKHQRIRVDYDTMPEDESAEALNTDGSREF